jgi:mannitol-1-/sugar-/sorbitol-6-phosphatase
VFNLHDRSNRKTLKTPITCKALLFDMDGVLIDSTPAVARVWRQWALEHGLDPQEVVAAAHGRPSLTTVRQYLLHCDAEKENREVERREMEDLEGVVLLPGAQELLAKLPPDRWTIVTSSTRNLAAVRLRAAGLPIPEKFITATDILHGKPHPEPYSKAAVLLGFSPTDCIVIEDVAAGVHAGKAARARVIGFTTTVSGEELVRAGANWIAENCAAISVDRFSQDSLFINVETLTAQSTASDTRSEGL